jgi:tRNA (guanine37-N1)-methyltransferase
MPPPFQIDIITIFPGMLDGFLGESMVRRAVDAGAVVIRTHDLRQFTSDVHRTTDDRPYGGGPGMVMKPEPLFEAVASIRSPQSRVLLMTPQGAPYRQARARELSEAGDPLIIICGHYEGIDERVREALVDEELSIGDYVLTNGVLPAAVVVDSIVRLLPGVLGGGPEAHEKESFTTGLLDYPQYTRPPEFRGMGIPEILRSGDHAAVDRWRHEQALERTRQRRPDLLED